ncbi:hypothetical protein BLNAU_17730 [Blattamonas nauphoetae]|uniref:Uncharacterized protein n=1 Tax=Blattamonas nauphoetae TaxID=2049346 RepID=A0ABQ9X6W9_9EUKA|nr:hypothetical protein BLNAU_17730 [Blattamonas nauphoetae]
MYYLQYHSMRDQNLNPDKFYHIIPKSLTHQYPPRAYGKYSTPTSLLRRCYVPQGKINDVQNPLVDFGRVVVAFSDQQKDFSPFLSRNEHSTVRLQAQRYAKQRADSLSTREVTLKPHIVWFPHCETDHRILMEQTGSQDPVHNWRFYSSIPTYPMNVAPAEIQLVRGETEAEQLTTGEKGKGKEPHADLTGLSQPTLSSDADAHVTTRQFTGAPTTSEEHRLSPNELDTDAEPQIGVDKQKDGCVDSSLKQEREHLVDPSTSSASNADLLRMIDSLKATLAETERQRSADKAKFEKELRTMGSVSAEEQSEPTRLKREIDRLTETMSDFQVLSASPPADKSTLEKNLVQTRKKMEMPRENNTRLEERLEETKRELTTERDTLKANLTATNQSLDESNQCIDTLFSEASSLLSQKTELERLLSKDWLTTTDTQTDWVGWSESAAKLASIEKFHLTIDPSHQPHSLDDIGDEIRSYVMLFTESDARKVKDAVFETMPLKRRILRTPPLHTAWPLHISSQHHVVSSSY